VVNPHEFGVEGSESPEGQAFVLLMQSAWGDWVLAGSKGENGAIGLSVFRSWVFVVVVGVVMGWGLV